VRTLFAVEIGGTADDAARHLAHEFLLAGEDAEIRSARDSGTPNGCHRRRRCRHLACLNPVRPTRAAA